MAGSTAPAPDFTWEAAGKIVHLSELKGHVVVLNFYATWCPPCQGEMPALIDASHRYASEGVIFVGIDAGSDSVQSAVSFAQQYGIDYQIVVDVEGKISDWYNVTEFPTTVVVDQRGDVVTRTDNELSAAGMDRLLGPYL